MEAVTLFTIGFFGIGGVLALSVVPWICIGTGLMGEDSDYV